MEDKNREEGVGGTGLKVSSQRVRGENGGGLELEHSLRGCDRVGTVVIRLHVSCVLHGAGHVPQIHPYSAVITTVARRETAHEQRRLFASICGHQDSLPLGI